MEVFSNAFAFFIYNEEPLLLIPADQTNNLYKLSKDNYNKSLTCNISKSYKKVV